MSTKKIQILGSFGSKIYAQNEEPIDAAEGSLWVDLDDDQVQSNGGGVINGQAPSVATSKLNITNEAEVGQIIKVYAVDENGYPTAWEAGNIPTDEHINELINIALDAMPDASEVAY